MRRCERQDERHGQRLTYDAILQAEERRAHDRRTARGAVKEAKRRYRKWLAGDIPVPRHPDSFLFLPLYCPCCGRPLLDRPSHTHHPFGYDQANRLRVVFMCRACHDALHVLERRMAAAGNPPTSGFRLLVRQSEDALRKISGKGGGSAAYNGSGSSTKTEDKDEHAI